MESLIKTIIRSFGKSCLAAKYIIFFYSHKKHRHFMYPSIISKSAISSYYYGNIGLIW